jgi:hypothetical protein
MDYSTGKKRFTGMVSTSNSSRCQECYANNSQVVLKYRRGPVPINSPNAANSAPADQEMTDAPATANASNSAAPASSDHADQEMPDAPNTDGDAAGNNLQASQDASTMTDIHSVAAALDSRRTLRTRTVRQPEQANALSSPASQRTTDRSAAIARRIGLLPPAERGVRGQRGGIIELPYIADPRLQRAPSPNESEIAAAHISSPSLLGMPPVVFQRIAKYVLLYEQPEELVQKASHRRTVEVTKAHVLTVSSEKVVRPGKKEVARNLNTGSLTNLFLVYRQFRDVGVKVYYGLNTFKFSDDGNLEGWAEAIGSRHKFVRRIQLESHWEVQFRNGEISPDALRIVSDHGIISSTAFRRFRNLQKVHFSIGCALEWQHDAFQQQHGGLDLAMESIGWTYACQQAEYMSQMLRDSELRSRTIDLSHDLIFDGAFSVCKSNRPDYHARMKDFVWKIRAFEAGLPKSRQSSYRGRASFLPGPHLPNTPAIVAPAPFGTWTQPYVNDESVFSDSSRFGLVYVHDNWAADMTAIAADLLAPRRMGTLQAKRTRRALWSAAVMPKLRARVAEIAAVKAAVKAARAEEARVEAARMEAEARAEEEARIEAARVEAEARAEARAEAARLETEARAEAARLEAKERAEAAAQRARWPAVHVELKTEIAQRAAVNAALEEEAAAEAARAEAVSQRQEAAAGQGMRRTSLNARR